MLRSSLRAGRRSAPALQKPGRLLRSDSALLRWSHIRRSASTVTSLENFPEIGEGIHGFTVQEKKHVPELHLTAIRLKHDKTDADYIHVAREDKNNVFGIGFKTNPPDATGVPHILEHTTLCGSEKYPIRDPFFKMLPRSLSNFMNAFTSADHTTYPFATTNPQDFQNLLSVYLDATFHPLLKEEDFRQEGWRLGPEDPRAILARGEQSQAEQKPEDILFKGVVYNEMKGQISDANYLYYIKYKENIIPALNNSGGDPQYITDLTHEQLVEFSKRNYHPSNAKIFTYGDMPLSAHLQQIGGVLDGFQKGEADTAVKLPIDLSQGPQTVTVSGPIDTFASEDKQHKTSTSWYMGDAADVVETFSAGILSSLLLDGYGSPLYRALIESGLGSSFTPNTGLDASGRVPVFSAGVTGVSAEEAPKVKGAIQQVFQECLATGFSDEKVRGFLHQLELALRHKTANFGIGVMEKTISSWFNGSNPMKELAWNEVIDEFKSRYEKGGYLESLMQKYLMNDNCLTFTMVGSPTWNQELDEQEMVRKEEKFNQLIEQHGSLEKVVAKLTEEELQLLKTQEEAQNADLSCLPSLRVADISREKERKPVRESKVDGVDVVWREAPTNGLTYFQALNAFEDLPDDLRLLMPLFNDCIMRLGTASKSMEQWEDIIKLKTGGISTSSFHISSPTQLGKFAEGLQFSGFALDKNIPEMLEIMTTLVTETDFTSPSAPAMIQELLRLTTNGALDAVAGSGHRYALNAAAAGLTRSFWVQEQQSGLAQLQATANLLRDAETSPERLAELIEKLRQIQSFAISKSSGLRVRMVCEQSSAKQNESVLQKWLTGLPQVRSPTSTPSISALGLGAHKAFYDMPYKVYYSGLAMQTVPFTSSSSASLSVLSQLLTHNYLHPEIREKGGAYGASAMNGPVKGMFAFTSYRDPNPVNTLKVFQNSGVFARDRAWSERELNEAKLGIFQGLDAPMSVDEEGARYFMSGVTHEMDQRWREQVLDVTAKDVNEAAESFLVQGSQRSVCLLGEKKDWIQSDGWDMRKLSMGVSGENGQAAMDAQDAAASA
ncbi:pitrilysin family metalloprotease cym1 [Aspergillus tubingensis]|uniref:pitrilysin family metalloprotease cym1 n=1 Tax=Aspergillus tubingensis TaxID=5068 RepID=UPI001577E6A3|nr:pitrilysin family metalloprotease [Aspergillus tubingensis]GFN12954.1 pitrilysin family metalloprotease [Aspergillus tubingensis]GLA95660.1 mitochondrial presequence protease [Aspergillus tubingensis]GLB18613.1 mitochondrial presequence protease [Aspergillus tubingensis]